MSRKEYKSDKKMYKLAHQVLCITGFNFETESLVGFVEMHFSPLSPDLRKLFINCQQCNLHRVSINDIWEPRYMYCDPVLDVCQEDPSQHSIEFFESCHKAAISSVDPDNDKGEICILLPEDLRNSLIDLSPFRVIIEFSLEKPKGGVKFVVPDSDGTLLERGAHLFTYGHENSSRLWFPCIDSFSEVCTWKLEITVSMYMIAVSCGDLIETIYTSDLRQKTYHYYLNTPTAAPNIALAVGPFEVWVDPNMHEVTNFCLPNLLPILKHTTSFLHEVFEFYEELLSTRYPYSCYKQVFVNMSYQEVIPYATMTICSTNLLHSKRVIDQTPLSQKLLAKAIAKQFFGCYISMNSWNDAWLTKGLSALLCSLYQVKSFGYNVYIYSVAKDMKKVCEHELNQGPVILDPSSNNNKDGSKSSHVLSSLYLEIFEMKSHLVMRMLEKWVGREFMLQVMNKILVLASNAAQQRFSPNSWSNMVISTASFVKSILVATGKDVTAFINQWIYQGGGVKFVGNFTFNRKRNMVELELKQDLSSKNSLKYAGPITVAVQELDGTFNHQFMIEENKTKCEIACHSKSRRQKKKKIPLCTGEEIEMNLDDSDADSPVLWLRVDPEMNLLRVIRFEQADFMWRYMLIYEKCAVAQLNAITSLEQFPTDKTRSALVQAIENDRFFYQVREDAAFCLMKVENAMNKTGSPILIEIFNKMFGSPSCPSIVRRNNFSNFQHYFLQKAFPLAISNSRNIHNVCPVDVLQFLLNLFKYNDNSKNKYSDCYYKASLIDALANTVTAALTTVSVTWRKPSIDLLTEDTKHILEEITRCLNVEKLLSCYRHTVTVSCLSAIRRLQRFGHLPSDPSLFKSYAIEGNFIDVRLSALEALVDYTAVEASSDIFDWLLDIVEKDPDPYLRFKVLCMLSSNPPFQSKDSPLNTESVKERLWNFMNSGFAHDCRLRCAVADLYRILYSKPKHYFETPVKERKSNIFSSFDVGSNSRDGISSFSLKRKSESPLNSERKSIFGRSDSRADDANDNPFKIKIFQSENSLDGAHYSIENRNNSPAGLNRANSLWSSICPSSLSPSQQPFSSDHHSSEMAKPSSHMDSSIPRSEMEGTVQGGDVEMNLSEFSSSPSSTASSPRFKTQSSVTNRPGTSGMIKQDSSRSFNNIPSFLSEDEDEDDVDIDSAAQSMLMETENKLLSARNKPENYDEYEDDDDDNGLLNLSSSESEVGKSALSSDPDDDEF